MGKDEAWPGGARVVESRYSKEGEKRKEKTWRVCRPKERGATEFYCINCDSPRPVVADGGGGGGAPPPLTATACACADILGIAA